LEDVVNLQMLLNTEQERAFHMFQSEHNVLIMGHAGTGKSYLISTFREYCRSYRQPYGITSTTGVASLAINGTTVNSFLGLGTCSGSVSERIRTIQKNKTLVLRYKQLRVLIIDEVSLLSAETLDKIHEIFVYFKKNTRPFGGIQMVLLGDFYQLRVVKSDEHFIFQSKKWTFYNFRIICLKASMRQRDPLWIQLLDHLRIGQLHENDIELLKSRCCDPPSCIFPTKLFATNQEVERYNETQLSHLRDQYALEIFPAMYEPSSCKEKVKGCLPTVDILYLTVKCQVMFLINNLDEGYANGTRGCIVGFTERDSSRHPIVELLDGKRITVFPHRWDVEPVPGQKYSFIQYPLKLSWALTIHKSQGMTLDYVETDINQKMFAYGQVYVALSRVRELSGLFLRSFDPSCIKADPVVHAFYQEQEHGYEL